MPGLRSVHAPGCCSRCRYAPGTARCLVCDRCTLRGVVLVAGTRRAPISIVTSSSGTFAPRCLSRLDSHTTSAHATARWRRASERLVSGWLPRCRRDLAAGDRRAAALPARSEHPGSRLVHDQRVIAVRAAPQEGLVAVLGPAREHHRRREPVDLPGAHRLDAVFLMLSPDNRPMRWGGGLTRNLASGRLW